MLLVTKLHVAVLRTELANTSATASLASIDAALLAFRDEETLATYIRHDTTIHYFTVEAPQQRVKRLFVAKIDGQFTHLLLKTPTIGSKREDDSNRAQSYHTRRNPSIPNSNLQSLGASTI